MISPLLLGVRVSSGGLTWSAQLPQLQLPQATSPSQPPLLPGTIPVWRTHPLLLAEWPGDLLQSPRPWFPGSLRRGLSLPVWPHFLHHITRGLGSCQGELTPLLLEQAPLTSQPRFLGSPSIPDTSVTRGPVFVISMSSVLPAEFLQFLVLNMHLLWYFIFYFSFKSAFCLQ